MHEMQHLAASVLEIIGLNDAQLTGNRRLSSVLVLTQRIRRRCDGQDDNGKL